MNDATAAILFMGATPGRNNGIKEALIKPPKRQLD
jgi:hypothetical protein